MPRRPAAPVPRRVRIGAFEASNDGRLFFIAGPCAFESERLLLRVGRALKAAFDAAGAPWVLKCSFDKANRTSARGFRGRGMARGLAALGRVKRLLGVPALTDVHLPDQAAPAARVADVLQVPAFLCRQTDLLAACARTRRAVNIKKGQFLAPWDAARAVEKVEAAGNRRVLLTERGTTFGYGNLVVDMRGIEVMQDTGCPVVFDATHSVQLPGGLGHATGGERRFAPGLARAAAAVGVAGILFETHPDPERALSDGPNSLRLGDVPAFVRSVLRVDAAVKQCPGGTRQP